MSAASPPGRGRRDEVAAGEGRAAPELTSQSQSNVAPPDPHPACGRLLPQGEGNQHSLPKGEGLRRAVIALIIVLLCTCTAAAQESSNAPARLAVPVELLGGPSQWTSPEGLSSALQVMLLLTVISLAPAVLMMTTCFVRVLVVLGLLRQALGTQQLPPNQVLTALALFITLAVMTPVWKQTYDEAVVPYTNHQIGMDQAWTRGVQPIRRFMSLQIERCGNADDVWLFMHYSAPDRTPQTYDDVPLSALLPAFMLSELKTAFLIGFQIYLPFLVIDMVVSSVLIAMGMMMLPPVLISAPFKLLLFVLIDGWLLIVGMLMESFQAFT